MNRFEIIHYTKRNGCLIVVDM